MVLLLDVGLRDDDSLRICVNVRAQFPTVRVIVMGIAPQRDEIIGFVHAGAVGFIQKDATTDEFAETIRHVAKGESALPRPCTVASRSLHPRGLRMRTHHPLRYQPTLQLV